MRRLIFIAAFLVSATPALAEPPARYDERGTTLFRSDALARTSYAWNTWLLGDDDTHVLVAEGELDDRPARYQGIDNQGNVTWTADHGCPNFDDYTTLFAVAGPKGGVGHIICKWQKQIIAVDMKTGKEAWRFSDPSPMYITAGAQNRVAVSIANQQLAVLDASSGRELMRIDVEGAVLESVAATKDGPLAFLVWDSPGREKDTIELAVGEGGALEKVELSGDDPNRKLVALPIGGPAKRSINSGFVPMKPRWTAPFGGYSFDVTPTNGAVIGVPREGIHAAWDISNGKLLWERPFVEGESLYFGEDGAAFARLDKTGNYVFGAFNVKTQAVIWQKPLPPGDKPLAGGQGGGDLGLVTSGGFQLVRYSDGNPRFAMRVEAGLDLSNLRSTPRSLLWVTQRDTERWVHFKTLPPL